MKVVGVFHTAAFIMSSMGTPAKRALEVAEALTSWARGLWVVSIACGQAAIAILIHLAIVSRDTLRWGGRVDINKAVEDPLILCVAFMYARRARTGHQTLSSAVAEADAIEGKNMASGKNDRVWFLARKAGSGMSRTPASSNLI